MSETDLTDYVALAAQTWVSEHTAYNWEKLDDMNKHAYLEALLPIVTVIIGEYKKHHGAEDMSFLGGIG
jgi:hypothetical protein